MAGKPGRSGRRPTPTAILKLRQTYRHDRHFGRENEPKPKPASLRCPTWLTGRARRIWTGLAPDLRRLGVLTQMDTTMFASFCVELAAYIEAVLHPAEVTVPARLKILATVKDLAALFGMDPTNRTRLRVTPNDAPDLDQLIESACAAERKEALA